MAAQEEEQSMEEILQSIKKIIAEDEEEIEVPAQEPEGLEALEATEELEIADMNAKAEATPEPKKAEAEPSKNEVDAMFDAIEVEPEPEASDGAETGLEEIAEALEEDDDILELTEEIEEDEGLSGFDEPEALEEVVAPAKDNPAPAAASNSADTLLTNESVSKAASALAQLKQPAASVPTGEKLQFRSGTTVEDLVLEALRPMLKEWLNNELPSTVERMVAEEIKRIAN